MFEPQSNHLLQRVDQAISSNPHLLRRKLRLETAGGYVVLRGTVGSYFQKQMAQEALRHLEGVERIDNLLEVSEA